MLELDAGFAGGVCRCSNCRTLMTVPKTSGGQAEQLVRPSAPGQALSTPAAPDTRPDRPGAPSSRSSRPTRSRTDSSRGRASSRSKSSRSKKSSRASKSKQAAPSPAAPPPPDREEVYQTASGKKIRINAARVPTASLRKTVRITTAGIVILFLAAVVAGVIAFGVYLFSGDGPPPPDLDREGVVAVQEEAFQYNSTVDPFSLDQPHAVGFPLRQHTAVVFDTSQSAEGSLPALHALLTHGLANQSSLKTLTLIAATAAGPSTFLEGPVELADIAPQALKDFLAQHSAGGERQLDTAVQAAIAAEPDLILLVAFGNPRRHADAITQALAGTDITTDILLVGGDSVTLERFLEDRPEGQLVRLPTSRFLGWYQRQSSP